MSMLWRPENRRRVIKLRRGATGDDELFLGVGTLRLNPAVLASDVADHAAALASGNVERAVELYTGPFLDGFSLPGADEFQRWSDTERRRHADSHARALEV